MQGDSVLTQSIIDKLHSSDIHRDQVEEESGATRSITAEIQSLDFPRRSNGRGKWC